MVPWAARKREAGVVVGTEEDKMPFSETQRLLAALAPSVVALVGAAVYIGGLHNSVKDLKTEPRWSASLELPEFSFAKRVCAL